MALPSVMFMLIVLLVHPDSQINGQSESRFNGQSGNRQDGQSENQNKFVHRFPAMGVEFSITAYSDSEFDTAELKRQIEERVRYLEAVFSDYQKQSEINRLSAAAPHSDTFTISKELHIVCGHSERFFKLSNGAFDPTIGPVSKIWRFARKRNRLPEPVKIENAMKSVGWNHVALSPDQRIRLSQAGMSLDFGGIAKGFAADELLTLLRNHGVQRLIVDAGGDIRIGEPPCDEPGWKVAVGQQQAKKGRPAPGR